MTLIDAYAHLDGYAEMGPAGGHLYCQGAGAASFGPF